MEKSILSVENLSVSYGDRKVLDNISFSIKENSISAVLCPNNCGKTTLFKAISGIIYSNSGKIYVNDLLLSKNNLKEVMIKISTILEDINDQFLCNTVEEELKYPLENLSYDNLEIRKIINNISNITKISTILGKTISRLSYLEKIKVLIAAYIVHNPTILLIDDIFRYLSLKEKKEIKKIIKSINDEYKTTIIFSTSDINDVIDCSNVIVINDGNVIMHDSFDNIIIKDNDLSKMGFQIPLMIDLSRKLQFYNLVDKIYYDRDKVVDKLWN